MDRYRIRVSKDYLTFSAAHFINIGGTRCERLHGHNYRVVAELEGPLGVDCLVLDFNTLKEAVRGVTDVLDHRVMIPLGNRAFEIEQTERTVRVRYGAKEWTFPREDCIFLHLENTSAELLAQWIARRLSEVLRERCGPATGSLVIRIEVEESQGQSALCEVRPL